MTLALATPTDEIAAPTELLPAPPPLLEVPRPTESTEMDPMLIGAEDALVQARRLVEKFPESSTALGRFAAAALNRGQVAEARAAAEAAIQLATAQADQPALMQAAQILRILGAEEVAVDFLSRSSLPTGQYLLSEILAERGAFKEALALLGGRRSGAAFALRGYLLLCSGDYRAAVHSLRLSLRSGPARADVLTNLGYAYAVLGHHDRASRATIQAQRLAPRSKHVALNLASYQMIAGDLPVALGSLRKIQAVYPDDVTLYAASAEVLTKMGQADDGLKELRRAKGRLRRLGAPPEAGAELRANIAFLEWKTGRRTRTSALETLRGELLRSNYASVSIGKLMHSLLTRISDEDQLSLLYEGLARVNPRSELYGIESHLAYTRGDYSRALAVARLWAEEEPFNPSAAINVTFLLSEVENSYEEAAAFGKEAVRRIPGDDMLRNNVAYALALAGDSKEARRYLPDALDSPYVLATRGLIRLVEKDFDGGRSDYESAAEVARSKDPTLADAIRLRYAIALCDLNHALPPTAQLEKGLREADDPTAHLLLRMFADRREQAR